MRTSHIGAQVFAFAVAFAAATFAPLPSFAEGRTPDCSARPADELDLAMLKSGGDKTRIATANTLVNQWRTTLPTLMVALTGFPGPTTSTPNQQDYFLSIVDVLRSILTENTEAIRIFRICRNDA